MSWRAGGKSSVSEPVKEVVRLFEASVRNARLEMTSSIWEQQVRPSRIFLIGAIVGIALSHGIVLYKIDTGIRSSGVKPVAAARSHIAFW
jgi:hypothetical protein